MEKPNSLPEWDTTEVNSVAPDQDHREKGWLAPGGIPEKVPYQTVNHWQNLVYKWVNAINQSGVLVYNDLTNYVANESWVQGSDGELYQCKINNGPASSVVNPVGDTSGTWINPFIETPLGMWYKEGLTLTRMSATTFRISVGEARDDTDIANMKISAPSFIKSLSAFAAGSGNGALDTGAVSADQWYHVYVIKNLTTSVVDVLISLSLSPTMPTGYTVKRWIGAIYLNNVAQITPFTQWNNQFWWKDPPLDVDSTITTTSTSFALSKGVPNDISVLAHINFHVHRESTPQTTYIRTLEANDEEPSITAAPLGTIRTNTNRVNQVGTMTILTRIDQRIAARSDVTNVDFRVAVLGWETDFRI